MIVAILTSLDRTSKLIFFKTPQNFHTQTHDLRKKKKKKREREGGKKQKKPQTENRPEFAAWEATWNMILCVVLSSREKGVRDSLYKPKPQEPRADDWNASRRQLSQSSLSLLCLHLVWWMIRYFGRFYTTVINSERREGLLITSAAFDPSPPPPPTPTTRLATPKIAPARPNARVHTQRRTIPSHVPIFFFFFFCSMPNVSRSPAVYEPFSTNYPSRMKFSVLKPFTNHCNNGVHQPPRCC